MTERKRRRRLDADAARVLILDVAEKQLAAVGPSGIRLQEVAAEAGVSHPTVLHHFGSREQLLQAVISRSLTAIHADLIEALRASTGDDLDLESLFENVGDVLQKSGSARIIMWLALEGYRVDGGEVPLGAVVDVAHARRCSLDPEREHARDDTARTVALATLALLSAAIAGPMVLAQTGLGDTGQELTKFRAWMARLVHAHLNREVQAAI